MPTLIRQKEAIRHPVPAHHAMKIQPLVVSPENLPSVLPFLTPVGDGADDLTDRLSMNVNSNNNDSSMMMTLAGIDGPIISPSIIGSWYYDLDQYGLRHNVQFYGNGTGMLNVLANSITRDCNRISFAYEVDESSQPNQLSILCHPHLKTLSCLSDDNHHNQELLTMQRKVLQYSIETQSKALIHYGRHYKSNLILKLSESLWPYPELENVIRYDGNIS